MVQVEVNDEYTINNWLRTNHENIEVMDVRLAFNGEEVIVMVVYKTK